jgi:hypothetical protein
MPTGSDCRHCVVCAALLPRSFGAAPQQRDPYPTCQTVACRMVASRRADMGEAGFKHYLEMQARHTQHRARVAQAALQGKADEAPENAAAFAALRARLPQALEREPLALLLPSGPRRANLLSRRRRERYRQHLVAIIAEAATIASAAPVVKAAASSGSALVGQVCATCGGGCCTRGAEKAYLSAQTMRRVMDARPGITDEELLESYLGRLAGKTQAGSCINHTAHGCSLPTELRSDICNRFSCESLAKLQAAQRGSEPVHAVLIVRRQQDHWHRNELAVDNRIKARAVLREPDYTTAAAMASNVS